MYVCYCSKINRSQAFHYKQFRMLDDGNFYQHVNSGVSYI